MSRIKLLGFVLLVLLLQGCDWGNPDDYPVGHWLKDNEDYTRASAAAIIKSGLPCPNYVTEDEPAEAAGDPPRRRVKTVDMWLGDVRFVIPAKVMSLGGYPEHHPRRTVWRSASLRRRRRGAAAPS